MAELRKCIGSTRFGIEPHEAPVEEFPKQPSQKDGLGRMCKPHWNQYTACLAREAKARQAAAAVPGDGTSVETEAANSTEPAPRRKRQAAEPTPDVAATEEPAT